MRKKLYTSVLAAFLFFGVAQTPEEAALAAADGTSGGTVTVLATWGGGELDSFRAMVAPFEEATGITVEYEGTRDLAAVLTTRVQGGNPPDVAGLPGPGQIAKFAQQGSFVDLGTVLDMDSYESEYAPTWLELGTVDGKLVGVFIKAAVKGLIWYDPQTLEDNGLSAPFTTWSDLMAASDSLASEGVTPWCVALESGAASGWPGTDWLEDIVLRQSGIDVYNRWWQGDLAWTSPEIKSAFETWGEIVATDGVVFGGPVNALTTNFGNVGDGLFTDPPECVFAHQASFIADFFVQNNPDLEPGTDFSFFGFPGFGEDAPSSTVTAGDLFGMFNDTPQARALIRYLVTPEAQAIWVGRGGAISPNQSVSLDSYPDSLSRRAAELLVGADVAAFDASDLMPEAVNNAFWQAVLEYIQSPDNLDSILKNLDAVREDAYAD